MPRPRIETRRLSKATARRFGTLTFRRLTARAGGKLTVLHITMSPGSRAPALHHARTDEFFFVLSGSAAGRVGGRRRRFRTGDGVFLPAGTPHEFTAGPRGVVLLDVFTPAFDMRRPDIAIERKEA